MVWLDFFNKAKAGDAHCQEVLRRFSRLIAVKRRKARMWEIVHEELVRSSLPQVHI
ncbi:hypothetical protein M413DRAFT_448254 [Hebeloma cylindrosporum]|uniref:Uncharacterized protein n=1 Tax=Hebeloma cylindrosporum TaxID=76867 RepID=A0A0C2XIV2_HEBCY|nr:hypothetical protein M413DRAFT_448254 [Hebeloma cylindrosporum h7]